MVLMMSSTEYSIEVDQLAVGLTRPPMLMGINIRLLFANMMFCALVFINVHTFFAIPLFIILHLLLLRFSVKDPKFLYLWTMAFIKTPPNLNYWYWGKANSYEPW